MIFCGCCEMPFARADLRDPYDSPYGGSDELWCEACIDTAGERQQEARDEAYYGGEL